MIVYIYFYVAPLNLLYNFENSYFLTYSVIGDFSSSPASHWVMKNAYRIFMS
jgi:hypothetical protein